MSRQAALFDSDNNFETFRDIKHIQEFLREYAVAKASFGYRIVEATAFRQNESKQLICLNPAEEKAKSYISPLTKKRLDKMNEAFEGLIPLPKNLLKSALYYLSSPDVPYAARKEAVERAYLGERIDKNIAKQIVSKHSSS